MSPRIVLCHVIIMNLVKTIIRWLVMLIDSHIHSCRYTMCVMVCLSESHLLFYFKRLSVYPRSKLFLDNSSVDANILSIFLK